MTELYHYGVKGMKWGVRRYRNEDGSLTPRGKKKYQGIKDKNIAQLEKRNDDLTNYKGLSRSKKAFYKALEETGPNSNKTVRAAKEYESNLAYVNSQKAVNKIEIKDWKNTKVQDVPDKLKNRGYEYYQDLAARRMDFYIDARQRAAEETMSARFNKWLFEDDN